MLHFVIFLIFLHSYCFCLFRHTSECLETTTLFEIKSYDHLRLVGTPTSVLCEKHMLHNCLYKKASRLKYDPRWSITILKTDNKNKQSERNDRPTAEHSRIESNQEVGRLDSLIFQTKLLEWTVIATLELHGTVWKIHVQVDIDGLCPLLDIINKRLILTGREEVKPRVYLKPLKHGSQLVNNIPADNSRAHP